MKTRKKSTIDTVAVNNAENVGKMYLLDISEKFLKLCVVYFQLPPNAPASVTLQPAPGDTGKVGS